jgi:hypothetical protein
MIYQSCSGQNQNLLWFSRSDNHALVFFLLARFSDSCDSPWERNRNQTQSQVPSARGKLNTHSRLTDTMAGDDEQVNAGPSAEVSLVDDKPKADQRPDNDQQKPQEKSDSTKATTEESKKDKKVNSDDGADDKGDDDGGKKKKKKKGGKEDKVFFFPIFLDFRSSDNRASES